MSDFGQLQPDPTSQEQLNESLSEGFLKNIPEADRAVVGRYVKDWDAGVTKRFQSIHDQYAPFKGMDVEQVQKAMNIYDVINSDPGFIIEQLADFMTQNQMDLPARFQQAQQQPVQQEWVNDGAAEDDNPYEERFSRMEQVLYAVADKVLKGEQLSQEQAEDAELDAQLTKARQQYGDFDEDYVLSKLAAGVELETAIQQFQKMVQSSIDSRASSRPVPIPTLGNGGAVPQGGVDPRTLGRGDTKSLVAQLLQHAQAQGQ